MVLTATLRRIQKDGLAAVTKEAELSAQKTIQICANPGHVLEIRSIAACQKAFVKKDMMGKGCVEVN